MKVLSKKSEKVVVDYGQNPLLEDMNLPGLMALYRRYATKEKLFAALVTKWKMKKDSIGASLQVVANTVGADILTYKGRNVTLVRPETSPELNQDKLRENLMLTGKMTAEQIETIFRLSTDPAKPKKAYVLVDKSRKSSGG